MTPFLIPALLLVPTTGTGGEDTAPGISLSSISKALDESMRVGGLLRAYVDLADDELSAVPNEDVQALRLYDAQLWFSAELAGYEAFVKLDAGETSAFPPISDDGVTTVDLRDAWVRKTLGEYVTVYVGQYKCPFIASASVGDGSLGMIDRTRLGQLFSAPGAFQPGVAVMGDIGPVHLKLSFQNGADTFIDGTGIVARGEFKVGEGAKQREGALDSEGFNATFGVGYFKDDSENAGVEFGSSLAADVYATFNALSLQAEVLDMDEELANKALGNLTEDATPYDATLGYLIGDRVEAFVRYQNLDNEVDADLLGAGANYYVMGHAMKWQLNVSKYEDDNIDGVIIQGGLAIGHSDRY